MKIKSVRRLAGWLAAAGALALLPAIGAELSGQERAMMIEAARADLYAQLARQIKGLKLSDETLVANHATAESARQTEVDALVQGVAIGEPEFIEDICLVPGSITIEQVVENLKGWKNIDSAGRAIAYENVRRYNEQVSVSARGMGTRKAPGKPASSAATATAEDGLRETVGALKGEGQEKLGAVEAARLDALVQLARQIKGLRISDQSLVNNMALEGRWTESTTNALIKGARVVRYSPMGGDLVSCVMAIDLQQVVENVQRSRTEFSDGSSLSMEKIRRFNPAIVTVTATGYGAIGKGRASGTVTPAQVIGSVR